MEYSIKNLIENAKFGEAQRFKNLSIFPVSFNSENVIDYISLDLAISKNYVKINEVTESGNVNTLFVENSSEYNVLLLDGEELIGAKQNRVLNTTILIAKNSKTEVPVSCVERGRWRYESREFKTSNRIMSSSIKSKKMEDVSFNLKMNPDSNDYRSDQGRVWSSVDELLVKRKIHSGSSAMSDAFDSSSDEMEKYMQNFKITENQNGIVIAINGKIIGFEFISNVQVFSQYFPKLMRGFIIDAVDEIVENYVEANVDNCREFVNNLENSTQTSFPSIGLGHSFRYESGKSIAAALVYNNETIHFSQLFREDNSNSHRNNEGQHTTSANPFSLHSTIRRKKQE
jgi:hypothetical protein